MNAFELISLNKALNELILLNKALNLDNLFEAKKVRNIYVFLH
jgi:hypothetical protein